jgi:hypothetical protein
MSKKSIREILCENCKMNCKLLANNALVFGCFFNHSTNEGLQKAFESYESQYKAEVEELKKSNLKFNAQNTGLLSKCSVMGKENESLKKKLEKAEEVIRFYANQENWYSHGKDSTIKRRIDLNDGEEFLNYEYDGKMARAYLKENV